MDLIKLKQRLSEVIFLIIIGGFVALIIAHKFTILDWFYFRTYNPSPQIVSLADDAGFNSHGRQLFYRGNPQLSDRETMDQVCSVDVIGCITPEGQIFILHDQDGKYYDEIVVTAAHEMLHLGYRRLDKSDRKNTDELLETASAAISDGSLAKIIAESVDNADRNDELHSVLGTNYDSLPPDLERYYHRYFSQRSQVVAAYRRSQ